MATPATAIPLDLPDVLYPLSDGPTAGIEAESGPVPALETQRFGILAGPAPEVDSDRRIEAWIASNLDFDVAVRIDT